MEDIKNKIIEDILKDKEIKAFCEKNALSNEFIYDNFPFLFTQKERNALCANCLGKKVCKQDILDMKSNIILYNNRIDFNYSRCPYKLMMNDDFIELLFVPENDKVNFKDVYLNKERANIISAIQKYFIQYDNGEINKGFYIYGKFGVGKTFILKSMAEMFANRKEKVLFVYYPDLVRSIKSSINNSNLETYIDKLKKIPILMLDDFGAESNSAFIRDEVLGPILQYRVEEKLPVFATSNLSFDQLKDHFEETKSDNNIINSSRIMERLSLLMDKFELIDKNYRQ